MDGFLTSRTLAWNERRALLARGAIARVAQGVYTVDPPPAQDDPTARWRHELARASLKAGPHAVVARSAAATLWGLDGFEPPVPIDVNVPRRSGHRHSYAHRVPALEPAEAIEGFAVTGLGQTLVELGAGLQPRRACSNDTLPVRPDELVELAVEAALRSGGVQEAQLEDLLVRSPRRRGAALLARVLARRPFGAPPTESYLETRGVQVLRNGGLRTGRRQVELFDRRGRYVRRVDLLLGERVVVEFDGQAFHDFERDREAWARLASLGYLVIPATYALVTNRPRALVEAVRDALASSSARPTPEARR